VPVRCEFFGASWSAELVDRLAQEPDSRFDVLEVDGGEAEAEVVEIVFGREEEGVAGFDDDATSQAVFGKDSTVDFCWGLDPHAHASGGEGNGPRQVPLDCRRQRLPFPAQVVAATRDRAMELSGVDEQSYGALSVAGHVADRVAPVGAHTFDEFGFGDDIAESEAGREELAERTEVDDVLRMGKGLERRSGLAPVSELRIVVILDRKSVV